MGLLQTIFAFLGAIALLVMIHELGHYLAARWCGVKVLRFSLGMGRIVYSRRLGKDQTEWAISILPLGGYVKLLDAREDDLSNLPPEDLKREFSRQSVWRRMAIVAAGPAANFLLAIIVLAGLYMYGVPGAAAKLRPMPESTMAWQAGLRGGDVITSINGEPVRIWPEFSWKMIRAAVEKKGDIRIAFLRDDPVAASGKRELEALLPGEKLSVTDLEKDFLRKLGLEMARPPAQIGRVMPSGPAMRAGLREGDIVQAVDGVPLIDGLALVEKLRASPGKNLMVSVLRGGQPLDLSVTPEAESVKGISIGKIMAEVPLRPEMLVARDPLLTALTRAVGKTWETTVVSIRMFGKMIAGEVSLRNLSGPLTIADYAGQTARIGAISYLSFIAFISISLGVMNLLPIPVLDGGLLLYYSYEVLTGRPLSERAGRIAQRVGLAMLAALMFVAVFNDIIRLLF